MDEDLLERFQKGGDRGALESLIRRHQDSLYRFLTAFLGARAAAEEATQETFLRVIRSARTYQRGEGSFQPWLYRIAVNTAREIVRSESSRRRREMLAARPE